MVLAPVDLMSISCHVMKKRMLSGMIMLIPSLMLFIYTSNSLSLVLTKRFRYSFKFYIVTGVFLPFTQSSHSVPSERSVTNLSSTVHSNS